MEIFIGWSFTYKIDERCEALTSNFCFLVMWHRTMISLLYLLLFASLFYLVWPWNISQKGRVVCEKQSKHRDKTNLYSRWYLALRYVSSYGWKKQTTSSLFLPVASYMYHYLSVRVTCLRLCPITILLTAHVVSLWNWERSAHV